MSAKNKILIIYGSLNSVPSPEGAAPAKVIYETVISDKRNVFKVLSNNNKALRYQEFDDEQFLHVKQNYLDYCLLYLLKLRYSYKKRKAKFITGSDAQLVYYISVCRWLFFKKYDKIIVHVGVGLVQMIAMCYPKKQIIYYHHGTSLHSKLSELQWKLLINNTTAIFGVNQIALKKANNKFKNQLELSRYFGINNAIIPSKIVDKNKGIESDKEVDFKEFSFAFSGRICVEKGVLNLLKAFKKVYAKNSNVKLYIFGGAGTKGKHTIITEYYQKCIDFVAMSNLPVEFTGFLQRDKLMELLKIIDVMVCPTDKQLSEEGMPLTIIEALSLSKPVIATNSGGNSEVIQQGKNGFLIKAYPYIDELTAGMLEISLDKLIYNKLSKGAYKSFLKKYTYTAYHRELTAALEECGFINAH